MWAWINGVPTFNGTINILSTINVGPSGNLAELKGIAGTGASLNASSGELFLGAGSNQNSWKIKDNGALVVNGAYDLGDGAGNSPERIFAEKKVNHGALTFATLPTPAAGDVAYITDCNTATWGATAAAGGANKVLVWYNGTNWTVAGA